MDWSTLLSWNREHSWKF